jgi:hypothetical protein
MSTMIARPPRAPPIPAPIFAPVEISPESSWGVPEGVGVVDEVDVLELVAVAVNSAALTLY